MCRHHDAVKIVLLVFEQRSQRRADPADLPQIVTQFLAHGIIAYSEQQPRLVLQIHTPRDHLVEITFPPVDEGAQ